MERLTKQFYEFGPFRVDPAKRLLLRDEQALPLTPKAFDILLALVQHGGEMLHKDELMRMVWPDTAVEENNLTRNISTLRKALGESPNDHEYIVTIPGQGYLFVADVRDICGGGSVEVVVKKHTRARIIAEEEEGEDETSTDVERKQPVDAAVASSNVEFGIAKESLTETAKFQTLTTSIAESLLSAVKRRQRVATVSLAIILIGIAAIVVWKIIWSRTQTSRASQTVKLTRLTTYGRAVTAALSPDGKYVSHVMAEKGQQSLWLRQIGEAHDVLIVPPAEVQYWSVTFSPDSKHIYYLAWEKNKTDAELYRVPVLGGLAKKLIIGVFSSVTFSPDGRRIAYVKDNSSTGQSWLMVADADGTEEQVLLTRKHPDAFSYYPTAGPAWSPDGKYIISAVGKNGHFNNLVAVRLEDKTEAQLTFEIRGSVRQIAWLEDSSGLITVASADKSSPGQIWHVSYPGGEARKITNDLNDYDGVSLNRNSDTIVTVQTGQISQLWVAPNAEASHARQLASEVGTNMVRENLAWTPAGKIVYCSNASGHVDLWIMDADGGNRRQLTSDAGNNIHPTVSPDGRYVVFASDRTGAYHLWRMNLDSGITNQLTDTGDTGEVYPHYSPDGRWVAYQQGYGSLKDTVWKAPIDDGGPVQLADTVSLRPAISPDGKLIAYYFMDGEVWGLAVISSNGTLVRKFVMPPTVESRIVHWSADGSTLLYIETREGVSNIWSQPLNDAPARKLTDFDSTLLSYFDWSPDGKHLAFTHSISISDVVLLTDFK